VLTRNGWWFAALSTALLVAGAILSYRELVILGVALLACLLAAALSMLIRPEIEVKREVNPSRVTQGDGASGVITITNVGRRRCAPLQATEVIGNSSIRMTLPSMPAGGTHSAHYLLPTERRGCYTIGPLHIGRSDPLSLVNVSHSDSAEATLWVLPTVHKASPIPTGRSQELEGPTSNSAPRGGIAFHSLREYAPGDDPRLIHWRSTARTGTLMVRHTVITNEPRLLIVLDTSTEPYDQTSFEDAVRVAASLVTAGADKRYPTEFRSTGGVYGSVDPTGLGLSDVMDKLAAVQPSSSDPGLQSLTTLAPPRNRGVSLGVVTGQPAVEQARTVGRVRGRFDMATIIQVGERFERPPLTVTGVLSVNAGTSAEWAKMWKLRIG
jgi:uncharacterized protein (DUF58 family)